MTLFSWLWIGWGLYFVVVEGIALYRSVPGKRGSTLSAHVWWWFGTDIKNRHDTNGWSRARKFALIAFMVWLTVHFVTGGWV